jgi:hypothetical protein
VLLAAVAIVAAACGGGGGTASPASSPAIVASASPAAPTPSLSAPPMVTPSPTQSVDPAVHECFQAQVVLSNAWGRFASDVNYAVKRTNKATTNASRAEIARQNETKLIGDRSRIAAIPHTAPENAGFKHLLKGLDEVIHSTAGYARAYDDGSRSEFDAAQTLGTKGFGDANNAVAALHDPSLCA